MTGDGAPDSLFRKGDRHGPGGLTTPRGLGLDVGAYDWVVGVSDVGLRGHADVLVRERRTGYLYLLRGTADGFAPRVYLGEGMEDYQLVG